MIVEKMVFRAALLTAAMACAQAVADESTPYAERDFARVEKIDTHVHLYGDLPLLMRRAREDNFRLLTINVNYADFPPLARQFRDAMALRRAYPDRVAFAATFDASGSNEPGWLERTRRELQSELDQGAVAVKVWKDIGMQHRDPDGRAVMIDDPRFAPLFEMLAARKVVVLGHQGEPRNAWLPLDRMTIRGDREYFAAHPQYHMYAREEWPSYEQQLAARDRMLDSHPDLTFVGVHLAALEWDVDRISEFLRRYPRASVDLAARLVHLELQASRDREKVRNFFIEFEDRILYGSDLARGPDQGDADFARELHEAWQADWRFLAGDADLASGEFDGKFRGLALPRHVVDAVYHGNARRLFPTAWRWTGYLKEPRVGQTFDAAESARAPWGARMPCMAMSVEAMQSTNHAKAMAETIASSSSSSAPNMPAMAMASAAQPATESVMSARCDPSACTQPAVKLCHTFSTPRITSNSTSSGPS